MNDFRERWGLAPKQLVVCPRCHTEHRGRCHFMRLSTTRAPRVEEVLRWMERKGERMRLLHARKLIRELNNAVEEGRRTGRWTAGRWKPTPTESRTYLGVDPREAKRNTLTREPTSED